MSTKNSSLRSVFPGRARLAFAAAAAVLVAIPVLARAPVAVATDPSQPHIDLPAGWEVRPPEYANSVQRARYSDRVSAFELIVRPRIDLAANVDLAAFAEISRQSTARNSKLTNRQETAQIVRTVAGHKVLQYDISGEFNGMRYQYRQLALQCGSSFCLMQCSTTPSHWAAAQPRCDELLAHLK